MKQTSNEPKFQVGDIVTATKDEGSSLKKGHTYKVVKVVQLLTEGSWVYWVKDKASANSMTMAFDNQLTI